MCALAAFNRPLSASSHELYGAKGLSSLLCCTPYFPFYVLKLLREQQLLRGAAGWLGAPHPCAEGERCCRRWLTGTFSLCGYRQQLKLPEAARQDPRVPSSTSGFWTFLSTWQCTRLGSYSGLPPLLAKVVLPLADEGPNGAFFWQKQLGSVRCLIYARLRS